MIVAGNARTDARERGWFIGPFMGPPGSPLHADAVEVKWDDLAAGQTRAQWGSSDLWSLSVLVRGRFRLHFADRVHLLAREGDFVRWGPGVLHWWEAEDDSLVLTVRWVP